MLCAEYGFNIFGLEPQEKLALYSNLPTIRAMRKLGNLSNKMFSAESMYDTVLEMTGSEDKASEVYTEWTCSLGNKDKVVNIDSLGFSSILTDIFGKMAK